MFLSLSMFFLLFHTVNAQESLKVGRFFNPPNADADDSGYTNNPIWTIGETKTIQFTTTYSSYTIALWQQTLVGGSATLGPIIFQTSTGAVTQFDWSVQLFEFDLRISNVFFLWLHSGDASDQGSGEDLSVSSHYINFTSSGSSSFSTSSPTPSAKASISSTSTKGFGTLSGTSIGSLVQTATSAATSGSTSGGGLSTGAEAGIGVGASLVGLSAIAGCAALILHLRKKSSASREVNSELDQNPAPETSQGMLWGPKESKWPASNSAVMPAELPGQSRIEMG